MPRTYAWIITDDHLGDDERSSVGVYGPRGAPKHLLLMLACGHGRTFKLYDDDDILYFTGHIVGAFEGPEPLVDYGQPGAGCTGIKYPNGGPELGGGRYL